MLSTHLDCWPIEGDIQFVIGRCIAFKMNEIQVKTGVTK